MTKTDEKGDMSMPERKLQPARKVVTLSLTPSESMLTCGGGPTATTPNKHGDWPQGWCNAWLGLTVLSKCNVQVSSLSM